MFQLYLNETSLFQMLLNLHKQSWVDSLKLEEFSNICCSNQTSMEKLLTLAKAYSKSLEEEDKMTAEQLAVKNVGRQVSF